MFAARAEGLPVKQIAWSIPSDKASGIRSGSVSYAEIDASLTWKSPLNDLTMKTRVSLERRGHRLGQPIELLEKRIAPANFTPLVATPDGAPDSLRDAITTANANGEDNVIDLEAGIYVLDLANEAGQENLNASGDLDLTGADHTITFNGQGADMTFIDQAAMDRVFQIFPGVTVIFNNLTITGGEAVDDGTEGALPGNADGNGGGILNDGGTVTLADSTVTLSSAAGEEPGEGGGGIYHDGGLLTLTNSIITGNFAIAGLGNGGGILVGPTGELSMTGGSISGNQAARAGGGIENNGGTVTLDSVVLGGATAIEGNSAGINGGGLHTSGEGTVTITAGSVSNNVAGQEGGGLWNSALGTLDIQQGSGEISTVISSNTANGDGEKQGGGGIFNDGSETGGGTVTIAGASIIDNISTAEAVGNGGGGIFNDGTMDIQVSTIFGNTATSGLGNGGGILNSDGGVLTILGGTIQNNQAARAGGGIENNAGTITMTTVLLGAPAGGLAIGNSAGINGGGLHTSGAGVVTIIGGNIESNVAGQEGGGLWNSAEGTLTLRPNANNPDVQVLSNIANGDGTEQGGGGLFNDGGTVMIRNGVFADNISTAQAIGNGGGGIFNDGVMNLTDTSFARNMAALGLANGGAILNSDGGVLTITGGQISANTAARAGGGIENNLGTLTLTDVILGGPEVEDGNNAGINGGGLHISGEGMVTINGGAVSNNTAGQEGGGLWNSAAGTLTIQNSGAGSALISANTALGDGTEQGGGGIFNDGGAVIITGATIQNNVSTAEAVGNGGGGIFNDGSLTISGTTISGNTANANQDTTGLGNGGGILNSDGGVLVMTGGSLSGNLAARAGGGIENAGGMVTLSSVTIGGTSIADGNVANINGGGLHSGGGTVTITGGRVENNVANQEGGGLWAAGTLNVLSTNDVFATITGNTANGDDVEQGGGGVFIQTGGTAIITGAVISNNVSNAEAVGNGGGGIFNDGDLTLNLVVLTGNTANTNEGAGGLGNGGAILNSDNGTLVFNGGTVSGNFAARAGGGIENNLGTVTLNQVLMTGNAAGVNGGALHISGAATVNMTGGSVTNNAAGNEGGGLWNSAAGTLTVIAATIGGNTARTGAGIFNKGAGGTITLTNSTVSTNTAAELGGGISTEGGGLVITNSTISSNQSSSTGGGGIYIIDGTVDISNSTIAANVGSGGGTGGLEQAGGVVTLTSTLIADNLSGTAPSDLSRGAGTLNASFSLVELLPAGAINGTNAQNQSNVDPMLGPLQNNGGPTQTHALPIGSPAVNTGDNPLNLAFDQRGIGFARSFGAGTDIGAFELSFPNVFASGSGKGGKGLVSVYDSKTGLAITQIYPFGKKFKGGVTVATGDVNGDDSPDVVTAKESGKPKLKIFDAISGAEIGSFTAFKKGKGTNLAVADIDGDGTGDIIAGIAKGKTQVAVFSGSGLPIGAPITPFDSKFKGGSTVAAGDVNGDGVPDIIVGQASKGGSVQVFDGVTRSPIADFLAFDGGFTGGVFVAAGDVNGDGTDDIITGAGKGQPIVHVFDGISGTLIEGPVGDFFALNQSFKGGVRVAATDFNGDGIADIIAGSGKKDKPPTIRVTSSATGNTIYEFQPKDASKKGGVFVG